MYVYVFVCVHICVCKCQCVCNFEFLTTFKALIFSAANSRDRSLATKNYARRQVPQIESHIVPAHVRHAGNINGQICIIYLKV